MRNRMVKGRKPADERDHPRVLGLYREVLTTFDVNDPWPLYVVPMGGVNAGAVGMANPFMVISLESLQHLEDDSLRVIIAHEVGHILSGHVLYKTMLRLLMSVGFIAVPAAGSLPVLLGAMVTFIEWERKSEFSADRASALAMGGAGPVRHVLEYVEQGRESGLQQQVDRIRLNLSPESRQRVKAGLDALERVVSLHPPIDKRIAAVESWSHSDAFNDILCGDYPRRGETAPLFTNLPPVGEWQARAATGAKNLSDAGERLSAAAGGAVMWLRNRAGLDR
ncbi:MAG: M48 family metallopeptidase [Myxococcota bacterium]